MENEVIYELANKIARNISLPLSVLFVFFGFIQQKEEVAKDIAHGMRYLALLGTMIAMIVVYPHVFVDLSNVASAGSEVMSRELADLAEANQLNSAMETGDAIRKDGWSWFSISSFFKEMLRSVSYCLMVVLNKVARQGRWIAMMIQSMLIFVCLAVAPLGISFLAVKQTAGAGVAFITGSLGVAVLMFGVPIMDMVFFSCFEQLMAIVVGKSAAATGLSSLFAPGASAGAMTMGASLILAMLVFILVFMLALYVIAPFAFLRFMTSGSIVDTGKAVLAGAIGAGMAAGNAETELSRGMAQRGDQKQRMDSQVAQQAAQYTQQENAAGYLRQQAGLSADTVQAISKAGALQPAMAAAAYPSMSGMMGQRHSQPTSPPIMPTQSAPAPLGGHSPMMASGSPSPPPASSRAAQSAPSMPWNMGPPPATTGAAAPPLMNASWTPLVPPTPSAQQPVRGGRAPGAQPAPIAGEAAGSAAVERPANLTEADNAPILPHP